MRHNSGTTIKCRFSNQVHKILEPNIDIKGSQRWKYKKEYSDKEKIKLFDEIKKIHDECSEEYTNFLYKRREKKRIHKQRLENGYYEKKKAKKEKLV